MSIADRAIALDGLYNLRELGGLSHAGGQIGVGRFWRSDSLHGLDEAGLRFLADRGLVTVIDLRQEDEAAGQPNPFASAGMGVTYHNAPIFAGLNLAAPEIVDAKDPLLALYCRALSDRAARFVAVMQLIADAPPGAVLFHCTVGKDRTGMVAAMLLRLAGVDGAAIVADFVETGRHIGPVLDGLRARAEANGWDVTRLSRYWRSDARTMEDFLDHLERVHGGVETFLRDAGLDDAALERIRGRLLDAKPHSGLGDLPMPARTA